MNAPSQKYLYKAFQEYKVIQTCCCCSVVQLCPTFCNPMGCSTPGLHVPHHLQKFAQVHIHCISDAIQLSHPLMPSSPSPFNLSKHQRLFQWVGCFSSDDQNIGASASASVLPMSIQGWFPLRWTVLIFLQSKGLSRVFSSTTVQRHQLLALCLLYSPALTTIHDHWEDHSLVYMDLCQQSDVSAFQHTV